MHLRISVFKYSTGIQSIDCDAHGAQDVKDSHEEAAIAAPQALRLCSMVSALS